jgi:DNA-binding response OmpR family regulator
MSRVKETSAQDEAVYDLTAQSLAPGVKSMLILEDDPDFSEMLRLFLQDSSFKVTCVANGVDGLRQVMNNDFDVIVCDLVMPNLPGDMFYRAVERTKKRLCKRFVFITGHRSEPKWHEFLSKIGGPVLEKPFKMADLVSTIQTLLTENALQSPDGDSPAK